jgi:glycerol-3-phosphate dehydrogenase
LLGGGTEADDRSISRSFTLIDHAMQPEKIQNFITITGGKLTTYRLMAEKTADLICRRLGVKASCRTQIDPLPNTVDARWTEPGLSPNMWRRRRAVKDILLCECEMVSQSVVDDIVANIRKQKGRPDLKAIGLRSRIGKGPCQGTFCSQRVTAYLYDRGYLDANEGAAELSAFLKERWRGQQPLLWDISLAQAELLEAIHCGFLGLELAAIKNNLPDE